MPSDQIPLLPPTLRRALLGTLVALLAALALLVLRPFVAPILWAAILAYLTWPAHRLALRLCAGRRALAAAMMALLVAVTLILPALLLGQLLLSELAAAYADLLRLPQERIADPIARLESLPWIGAWLHQSLAPYAADPALVTARLGEWAQAWRNELLSLMTHVSLAVARLFITLVTLFFVYRDGERFVADASHTAQRALGDGLERYARAVGTMVRAVVYGVLATALAQGAIALVGYLVFGVEAPLAFGVLTTVASLVPLFGTLLVWGPLGITLVLSGHWWSGVGLLAWGALLVNPTDNVLRPLLISNATQLPFLLIVFGVFGGLSAFGLIGVFLGPAILSVCAVALREWQQTPDDSGVA